MSSQTIPDSTINNQKVPIHVIRMAGEGQEGEGILIKTVPGEPLYLKHLIIMSIKSPTRLKMAAGCFV